MENTYKISSIIDSYISGDWGNDCTTDDTPYPVYCVRGADIVPISNSQFNDIPLRYVSKRSFQTRCLQEGDIIIEKSGGSPTQSTGRVVYVSKELLSAKKNIVCSNFCTAFRVKEGWNAHYVFLYLQNVYNSGVFFNFEGKTSGLKNLMLDAAFKSIPIKKITIAEQTALAYSISAIDKKLSLNRQINDNLEAMAKQFYDYWFVQFDFPNEEGKPYKSSGGAMVWNEKLKRKIPNGWTVETVGTYANCKSGYAIKSSDFKAKGIPVIKIGNIQEDYTLNMNGCQYIDNNANKLFYVYQNDVVIAMTGATIGKFAIVPYSETGYFVNQRVGKFELGNNPIKKMPYLINSLKIDYFRNQIFQLASGCAQPNISAEQINNISLLYPSTKILSVYNMKCKWMYEQIANCRYQIDVLTKLRDKLLPLLMNGQASVNSD